jgi:hypothetical protein
LFINGVLVSSETDTTLKTGGGTGIIDSGGVSSFQNFSAAAGVSFADTFQRPASPPPTLGSAYSQDLNNGFNISGGNAVPANTTGLSVASLVGVNNLNSADVVATIASIGTGSVGVVADWNAATHSGYALLLSATQVQLVKVVNGASSPLLSPVAVTPHPSSNSLELEVNGSTLTAYLNGQFLFTFTDNTNPFTLGSVGLTTNNGAGAAFSSFSVVGP